MKNLQKYAVHLWAIIGFIGLSIIYFYPVLQGKQIYQHDIAEYTGMAKEQNDFRNETNEEPYWTNSAFGGMPTYQLGAKYPNDFIGHFDDVLRFLPRPADYLFLYFLGFYVLLLVLKIDPLKAFIGALAFGFSTYMIIIIGAGHNAKAHAIAYMPMVLAGVLLVFRKKYLIGGLLTMIATALEIQANHFQMTYYLLLLLLVVSIFYVVEFIKQKQYKELAKAMGVFAIAALFAVGSNATSLLATSEYAAFSTRSNSELSFEPDGSKKENSNAMSYEYITDYSYGIVESLNLIAPRIFGGASYEDLGKDSEMYQYVLSQGANEIDAAAITKQLRTYWGDQPGVSGPAYIGIIVFFLAILSLFIEKSRLKYALLAVIVLSLMLSWGKNFPLLTDFFIDYVPLYNKFRAVSSIQVLLELCMPVLAVLGWYSFYKASDVDRWNALWKSGVVVGVILLSLLLFKGMFSFSAPTDSYYVEAYGPDFLSVLKEDRAAMYSSDVFRSFVFFALVFALLFASIKNKISQNNAIVLVGFLLVFDLFLVDKKYVNNDNFKSKREVEIPYELTEADAIILKDTTHFRVFETAGNMSSARSSYFHKSLGGYSAVKPKRMQELFDYQIAKNNLQVINMLNTKYIIKQNEEGENMALINPEANGNAWFVEKIKMVKNADAEMKALDSLKTKTEAVINNSETKVKNIKTVNLVALDSLAKIDLIVYKPNHLKYQSTNSNDGFAVFSEMYYKNGWVATINGKETPIYRVNYALRGIEIPAGSHSIEFKFDPQVVKTGSTVALFSSIGMLFLVIGGIYFKLRKRKTYNN